MKNSYKSHNEIDIILFRKQNFLSMNNETYIYICNAI